MSSRRHIIIDWTVPTVVFVGLTIPFWVTDLDVSVARRFYVESAGWPHGSGQPWSFLYHYGVIPAWVVSVSALVVFAVSFRVRRFAAHRRSALFLVLVMIVGPGLLVNDLFKERWGRPRPKDLVEFSGEKRFVKVWIKSPPENGNSFASGHASTGFYLLTPYFLLRRRAKWWALFFVALGIGYGSFIGLARMIQGAHFLSDVLWALGIVYLTGLSFFYLLRLASE
jgi:membrane-associated PAP2 superfamily phosphatase